ncbi:MAG: translation initiation factor IF-2 [Candidatus Omnitrophica bacterium]|nr:translation initiation factor IF-2 [Candidatus Omnitrophota bacterium]MCM8770510.1 translation initiation factor IF-2 [Candidatus Omnitrophota bacterium]
MKVHELAKELGLTSRELLVKLKALKINAKSHLAVLDEATINNLRKTLKVKLPKKPPADVLKVKEKPGVKKPKIEGPKKITKAKGAKIPVEVLKTEAEEAKEVTPPPIEELKEISPPAKEEIPPPPPPAASPEKPAPEIKEKELELDFPISVKDLSIKMQEKPSLLIKKLMDAKIMAGINQLLDEETATKICASFGFRVKKALPKEELALAIHRTPDPPEKLKPRPPVVTFMGHVDHGKTSLLDAIRKTQIVEKEYGGITQHIGAYKVVLPRGKITFLDTPGHEAFTAMRARGAAATDIVVLVVAADDGVMPQTVEAIDHARAAGAPIVVAVNKIDKPQADIGKVKKQLSEYNLLAEDWGGKTITVGVSAKTGEGINDLLEMILLEAEMLELKANYDKPASGIVIEAKLSKGKGPVATLIVQNGTLHLGDYLVVGKFYGKVKSMHNDQGRSEEKAEPSEPVEISGLTGVPEAGERFYVVEDEKIAKEISFKRQEQERTAELKTAKKISLDDLYKNIKEGKIKELKIILKADVRGSLEAIKEAIKKLNISEIQLNIIHEGIGAVNTSDVILAAASDALILGFNVEVDNLAKDLIAKEGVEVRTYNIIYELTNELKVAVEGLLAPKLKKIFLARLEVRKVFQLSKAGTVAGCFVSKGRIIRQANVAVLRNGQVIFEGKLSSLKHFKDDVREVTEGSECGLSISGFDAYQEGDVIEAYEIQQIARRL